MISHKHKYIYIHICKCAGSTISSTLPSHYSYKLKSKKHIPENERIYPALSLINYHFTIHSIQNELNEDLFKEIFKFTFVRNPWSRIVSAYFFDKSHPNKRNPTFTSFSDYLKKIHQSTGLQSVHKLNCLDWISDKNGNVLVDYVGRFEHLQQDFDIICDKIGIPRQQLPQKNKTKHKHYTEYYDDETREIVAEKYVKDIEYFGYKFGE